MYLLFLLLSKNTLQSGGCSFCFSSVSFPVFLSFVISSSVFASIHMDLDGLDLPRRFRMSRKIIACNSVF